MQLLYESVTKLNNYTSCIMFTDLDSKSKLFTCSSLREYSFISKLPYNIGFCSFFFFALGKSIFKD